MIEFILGVVMWLDKNTEEAANCFLKYLESNFEAYPTADRDIAIALGSERDWPRFCVALEIYELIEDPGFKTDEARIDNRHGMNAILNEVLVRQIARHFNSMHGNR